MCQHQPTCPSAEATDREAARIVASFPEQGWSLLCNGVIVFEDTGELLPDGSMHRPAPRPRPRTPSRPDHSPPRQIDEPPHPATPWTAASATPRPRRSTGAALAASVLERLRRRARADQVPVAVRAVDAPHRRPVLRRPGPPRPGYAATDRGYGCAHSSAVTIAAVCGALASGLSPSGHSPAADPVDLAPGSRSSRRRTGPARPGPRSRSAPPSASRPPGTTSSARGSRSRSAAWPRRPRVTPVALVIGRRSRMHSCATRPLLPAYSTG